MRVPTLLICGASLLTAIAAAMAFRAYNSTTAPATLTQTAPPAATPNEPAAANQASPPASDSVEPLHDTTPDAHPTVNPAAALDLAINLLREGELAAAQVRLEHVMATADGTIAAQARLLWAACAEAAHDDVAAKAAYLQAARLDANPRLRQAAVLGAARLQLRSGDAVAAVRQLQPELLQLDDAVHPGEVLHLWAQAQAEAERIRQSREDRLQDATLESVCPTVDLEQMRAEILNVHEHPEPHTVLADKCRLDANSSGAELRVTLSGAAQSTRTVLEQLASQDGKRLTWAPATLAAVEGRTQRLSVTNLDCDSALEALLGPLGLTCDRHAELWSIQFAALNAAERSEVSPSAAASDALRLALRSDPDHHLSPLSRLRLAQCAAAEGRLESAVHLYRELLPDLIERGEAQVWFNLGKLHLRLGDRRPAATAFTRCVDLGAEQPLQTVAYLYLGRVQIELGEPRAATAALQRALLLARGTPEEPLARVLLASAWLMARDDAAVSAILSHDGAMLSQSTFREAAAFLDAQARYSAQTDPQLRIRDATHLLDALTRLRPAELFGDHWELLAAHAYDELGLTAEAQQVPSSDPTRASPLRASAAAEQFERRLNLASLAQLKQIAAELDAAPQQRTQDVASLQVAQAAFCRGDHEAAATRTQALLRQTGLPAPLRRQALQLLGRTYQSRGEHAAALQCFVGVVPSPASNTVANASTAGQTDPSLHAHAD